MVVGIAIILTGRLRGLAFPTAVVGSGQQGLRGTVRMRQATPASHTDSDGPIAPVREKHMIPRSQQKDGLWQEAVLPRTVSERR